MDAALLKERDAFLKRARAQPTVEKKSGEQPAAKKFKPANKLKPNWATPGSSNSVPNPLDYKTAKPTSTQRFSVLHKVVDYLKKRHHRGDTYPISLDDLLDEANMLDILPRHKEWLDSEALKSNLKVEVIDGNIYKFKPKLPITTRKELLLLLKSKERKGLGGIWEEDIEEALPNATKDLDSLLKMERIFMIQRSDKKRVVYFKDPNFKYKVDEEFVKLWRSAAVDSADEKAVEEYLKKQGISSMENVGLRNIAHPKRKPTKKRAKNFKKLNDHLGGLLEDYTDKT